LQIYFAGVDRPSFLELLWANGARNILISYADYRKSFATFSKHLDKYKFKILLDSGAYSAYTRGIELDIEEYTEFLKEWGSYFERYFNLDVIGDFEGTWDNQFYLEGQGLHPVPVLHYGEPVELIRLLARQYKFIGLGGMVPILKSGQGRNKILSAWFDDVFYRKDGEQKDINIKFHALGLTVRQLLQKYNFYSSDSTRWLIGKKYNKIILGNDHETKNITTSNALQHNIRWHIKMEQEIKTDRNFVPQIRLF